MPKASPLKRSFNAGEFSPMVEGRTDLDRYGSSCRSMNNYVAAPQGAAIPRSGTAFIAENYESDKEHALIPFVFSETEAQVVEFGDQRVRFCTETGLLVQSAEDITITATDPLTFTSAGLGGAAGDQIVWVGFDDQLNFNAVQANIITKVGTTYTVDTTWPVGVAIPAGVQAALVYAVDSPYGTAALDSLRSVQSLDVLYLTNLENKPYKLSRNDTYDWTFEAVDFLDGPYLDTNETATKLTPDVTGKATPDMTGNTAPSGTASASSFNTTGVEAYRAFDDNDGNSYWQSNINQTGTLSYQFDAGQGQVIDGYAIHIPTINSNTSFVSKDYAPQNFTFEASNDGVTWDVLDTRLDYVLYDNMKSQFFNVKNDTSYEYYRLVINEANRNGSVKPAVKNLVLRSTTSRVITLTASATTGINGGDGFASTDLGRLIRLKGSDQSWRSVKITAVTSATEVVTELIGEPLPTTAAIVDWRLGYWSDTTGYPNTMTFYQDRTWWGGSDIAPDLIVASVTGDYENMASSTPEGEVLDTSSMVFRLNSRRLSRVKWLAESNKGLLAGTGSAEYVISSVEGAGRKLTTETLNAPRATQRGSSDVEPVVIDDQVIYVQRSGRTVREYAYVFEADNYKSPSMSLLSNHIGAVPFKQLEYAAEPYSIVWARREDGTLAGLTYNRDENVVGWHQHNLGEATIEAMAVIPAKDQLQDVLFLSIKRTINGQVKRYIEKLTRFWDFDLTVDDAHYVDSALRYIGAATDMVYGLAHLEGEEVYGLADGIPIGPLTVADGAVSITHEAENIIVGLGFDGICETSRLENGAADGTAIGKEKRIHSWDLLVWRSYGGDLGWWDEDKEEVVWSPVIYEEARDELAAIDLFDNEKRADSPGGGYNKRGTVFFRRPKNSPLPFNVVAIMPRLYTQDAR